MAIKKYEPSDRTELESCIYELQMYVAHLDPLKRVRDEHSFNVKEYVDYTLKRIEEENGRIYFAMEDDIVQGCIVGIIPQQSSLDTLDSVPSRNGIVLELVIKKNFRGMGIGPKLLEYMEEYFRNSECTTSGVDVFAANTDAVQFYKTVGYKDRMVHLKKPL